MLAAGAQVVLIDRDEEKVVGLCDKLGPKAPPLVVGLLDGPAVSRMLPDSLALSGGRFDIFHANANANAGADVGGAVTDGDPDVWDRRPVAARGPQRQADRLSSARQNQ